MERSAVAIAGWKDLPMELLLRVLSLLDDSTVFVASSVCKGWRIALCLGLTSFSLSWCNNNMNNLVQSVIPKFVKLQDLDLSKSRKLSDHSLYNLARGCPCLTKLNISGCSGFSDSALAHLASCCRNLKYLNLCGCVKAASDKALQAISYHCNGLQSLNLGWCDCVTDKGVTSLAAGCPNLRALDLCGCVLITDESVIALANGCPHLRSLDLYYCQNITDRAMYSLANSHVNHNHGSRRISSIDKGGLMNLNISQCTALTPPAVQAVCNSFPELHTCPERHSLIISGCLNLTSVHCACAIQANRASRTALASHAY
ncbi:hypothetical protein OPV22_012081 [Ensete ventricosum]|uniref:F-box domain-containing protein n=1 Tax=Ensete ventricosum TaxID=4639 RepID=A0AAV8R5B6_ENSVE|nr:hypothetical protein OPV22_012081 [Ensete ventricosum]